MALFHAHVGWIGWGVSRGQGIPSGLLPDIRSQTSWVALSQRFQVRLVLDDAANLPLRVGMTASVSVYPEPTGLLTDVTETLHEIIAWFYYL